MLRYKMEILVRSIHQPKKEITIKTNITSQSEHLARRAAIERLLQQRFLVTKFLVIKQVFI